MPTYARSWIVFHTAPWLLKKLWLLIDHFDSQALMPALSDQNCFEFPALYTLQHSLTRNTQFRCGYDHGHVLRRRLLHDARPQFIIDTNLPRRTRSDLLTRYETVRQPAMNAGCVHSQNLCRLANGNEFSAGRFSWRLEARDFA